MKTVKLSTCTVQVICYTLWVGDIYTFIMKVWIVPQALGHDDILIAEVVQIVGCLCSHMHHTCRDTSAHAHIKHYISPHSCLTLDAPQVTLKRHRFHCPHWRLHHRVHPLRRFQHLRRSHRQIRLAHLDLHRLQFQPARLASHAMPSPHPDP